MNTDYGYCQNYQKMSEKNTGFHRKNRRFGLCDGRKETITTTGNPLESASEDGPEATDHG